MGIDDFIDEGDDIFSKYPKLKALKEKVEKLPKAAAWIA